MTMSSTVSVPATRSLNMLPNLEMEGATKAILNLNMAEPFTPQAQEYLRGLGDARGFGKVALVGQAVAALLVLPALEMLGGLPSLIFKGFGSEAVYEVDAASYRHNTVRSRRKDLAQGETFAGYTLLDGSGRGLTPVQLSELATSLGVDPSMIRTLSVDMGQVDMGNVTAGMVEKVIATGITFGDLTSGRTLFLPGGAGIVASFMGVTIYGLGESWPRTLRLAQDADKVFHLAEVVDPQGMRQWGVGLSAELDAAVPRVTLTGAISSEARERFLALAQEFGVEVRG